MHFDRLTIKSQEAIQQALDRIIGRYPKVAGG